MHALMILSMMACDLDGFTDMFGSANDRAEQAAAIDVVEPSQKKEDKVVEEDEEVKYTYNPNNKRDPFVHYLKSGEPIGDWNYKVIKPSNFRIKFSTKIKVALHIHVHYPELLPDIYNRINKNNSL